MTEAVIQRLIAQVEQRYRELSEQLADPDTIADRVRYAAVARSHRELEDAHRLAEEYRHAESNAAGAEELLAGGDGQLDASERGELHEEIAAARKRMDELEERLRLAMVERDPNDSKNVIVEIRGGAGGDEAALFAGDLFRMLTKYAERRGFKSEVLSQSGSEAGGFKEVVFEVKGEGAYSVFKYEAGVHRVQRVPKTESQGRIHTSTATVAVLPEAEDVEVDVDPNELQIDVYRSSGPGGQSVNTTDSAVRITHKPSGIVVSMQDEKSQLQNRERAMRVLRARLYERALQEQQAELAADRRAQVGTGERSEKVRTYNFPQGRVTDHRIKLTTHNLQEALEGALEDFTDALAADERRRKLEAQAA
jgi:peptide chain release factor 1